MTPKEMKMAVLDQETGDVLLAHGVPSEDVLVLAVTDGEDGETGVIELTTEVAATLRDFLSLYLEAHGS